MSAALAVPEPTSLVAVHDQCAAIEAWAEQCDSVPELKDATNKLAAIDEYLSRTTTEGRGRVAAAMRRLEVRIGGLLGPGQPGGWHGNQYTGGKATTADLPLTRHERQKFRAMADHADVVEDVIEESDDDRPASRNRVLNEIKETRVSGVVKTRSAVAAREVRAGELAAAGCTSSQIAQAIGLTERGTRSFCRARGIKVPADEVGGKTRRLDSNRIVDASVSGAEISPELLGAINYADLDRDSLEHWVSSLTASIRSLTTLRNNLRKEQTNV